MPRRDPRFPTLEILDHPLLLDRLTQLRDRHTEPARFRHLVAEAAWFVGIEATRDLALGARRIETPLMPMEAPRLAEPTPLLVAILRAGLGMVEGLLQLLPDAPVGHLGHYRDPASHRPVAYYARLPAHRGRRVLLLDPMLATGGTAVAAMADLARHGIEPSRVTLLCLLAAPEGVLALTQAYPDLRILTAALDERLDERAYIRPGLGDAGDRQFGG
ncbi:MAG TPA: uracil phosphoribosyltransferase [Hypericibacter adhaerens]|jgi:uracil phosphoribosyltransferase|uniref:uracil phosphoribosyltransferase n=1 Tax=Hypericibacter adhaerens TaxID=2602016 RepID=UPI002BF096E7|nr:uracil phosphoribosyltransferase [Hypericibacter adhaerens]HWA42186.1 uracil phosphoribosyltransferase [Hypericibacter adhaerens]